MTNFDKPELIEPPIGGDETGNLIGSLERQRRLLAWKCGGLDAAAMNTRLGSSSVTLGGLLKHLALVEDDHFARLWRGRTTGPPPPWDTVDFEAEPDWEWTSAASDSPEWLHRRWREAVARSREAIAEAVAKRDMDREREYTTADGRSPMLRQILIDMVEEYSRHNGHADLVRESVDGLVGEDPPRDFEV